MLRRACWIVGLGALIATGCAEDEEKGRAAGDAGPGARDTGVGDTPRGGNGDPCSINFDCDTGLVCVNSACTPGQCTEDLGCPSGQRCDLSTYTCSGSDACAGDGDCPAGRYCAPGGECVRCLNDDHCNMGQTCNAQNRCVASVAGCQDGDGDGYGIGPDCTGPDCDDSRADVNPGQTEDGANLCGDGVDNNCDGADSECGEQDNDNDGVSDKAGDCNDNDPAINPNQPEVPYDGKDNDCDPQTKDDDVDGDGYPACEVAGEGAPCDCDDRAVHINPEGREVPGNEVDEDCDGELGVPSMDDRDGDGVTEVDGDCNDDNPNVNPNVAEVPYNGIDDDCSANTPDNDLDADGFDSPEDCDDENPAINPNASEVFYNGADDDCDPATKDADADGDGFPGGNGGADCNDESAAVNPDADEVPYNGVDDDCDAETPDDDIDGDGFVSADDCDDMAADVNPDAVENADTLCSDGVDHDCRGGDVECDAGAPDADGDGIPDDQDCAPMNAEVPGPIEIPGNGVDDDCDPSTPDEVVACDDDAFDEAASNDLAANATAVEDANSRGVRYGDLVICPDTSDWYQIDLNAGDGLEVDVAFTHAEGDIDVSLWRAVEGGEPVFVDSSLGVQDTETVYLQRANQPATYLVRVYRFRPGRSTYSMTVNVFQGCQDDAEGPSGEQNDTADDAASFPPVGQARQLCDFDDDYYRFTLASAQTVRIDLLFAHANGDLDMRLLRAGDLREVGFSTSTNDDELIEADLEAGDYIVRVYGFREATGSYLLFRTSGETDTARISENVNMDIPDAVGGIPGVADVDFDFEAPAGAVIRTLTIRDLDINHAWLPDLVVTARWNGLDVVNLWNRYGDENGRDAGLDDDFLPLTGGDINFDNRVYREFAGLPANGRFTLHVEDRAGNDVGEIADLDVQIEYLIP